MGSHKPQPQIYIPRTGTGISSWDVVMGGNGIPGTTTIWIQQNPQRSGNLCVSGLLCPYGSFLASYSWHKSASSWLIWRSSEWFSNNKTRLGSCACHLLSNWSREKSCWTLSSFLYYIKLSGTSIPSFLSHLVCGNAFSTFLAAILQHAHSPSTGYDYILYCGQTFSYW